MLNGIRTRSRSPVKAAGGDPDARKQYPHTVVGTHRFLEGKSYE